MVCEIKYMVQWNALKYIQNIYTIFISYLIFKYVLEKRFTKAQYRGPTDKSKILEDEETI